MKTTMQDCKNMWLSYEESKKLLKIYEEVEKWTVEWVDEDTFWEETFKWINDKMKKNA